MTARILAVGTAVPEGRVSQERALELALPLCNDSGRRHRLIAAMYRQSGVSFRHSVLVEENSGVIGQSFYPAARDPGDRGPSTADRMRRYVGEATPLATRAARRVLDRSGRAAAAVTHLITVSCTGFAAPGVDIGLIENLHLAPTTARTHVGFMGCHGAMNGLRMARAIVEADPRALVLVTAIELCSLHQQYGWDRNRIVANALFADGAASVLVSGGGETHAPALLATTGSTIYPETNGMMGWTVGDHGFQMNLSARVPDVIRANLKPWVVRWLGSHGLALGDIGAWAVHPGGPRILTAVEESIGLGADSLDVSRAVLSGFGNMSSPTVLFILERFIEQSKPGPWVVLGFGPGLAVEGALVTIGE